MFLENVYMVKTLMDNAMIFHWKFKKIRKNCEAEFDIVYYEEFFLKIWGICGSFLRYKFSNLQHFNYL